MRCGLIGYGFISKATHNGLLGLDVKIYDPNYIVYNDKRVIFDTDVCFICVPTPTLDGKQDPRIVLDTLKWLDDGKYSGLIVIKSTLLPKTMRDALILFGKLNIMANPEFLDQATYLKPQTKQLIGVTNMYQYHIYKQLYPNSEIMVTDPTTAFMAKYTHNVHGALKVTFFNEIYDVCNHEGISYREMLNCVLFINDNVGAQYTRISADGQRGYGGACLIKDTIAFNNVYNLKTLDAATDKNMGYRYKEMEKCL